jgi:HK97 family phage portal protein
MSWFDRLIWDRGGSSTGADAPPAEQRSMTRWIQDFEEPWGTTAGEAVSTTSAMGLSAAYSAVGLIADSISTLPVDVVVEEGGRRLPVHPLERPRWLDRPGGGFTRIDVMTQTLSSLLIHGEAIILTPRVDGMVQGLGVVDPSTVTINPDGTYLVKTEPLETGDFLHIRGLLLPGNNRGVGPISYARESFAASQATQKFSSAFFGNGAWVGGVVEVPGTLSDDGVSALKAYINERHRGAARAHKIGVLLEGAKLSRPLSFSPEDSQFLETREFQVADIARFFFLDPTMIGGKSGDSLTYSTLEGKYTHFVKHSLLRWIVRVEEALTALWLSEGGPLGGRIKLNVNALLRGSTKERYDAYAIAIDKGWMTTDEVRALEDLPPREGAPDGQ